MGTASADRLMGRAAWERLLGAGTFCFADNSGRAREGHIRFDCGCRAQESEPDRFRLAACEDHRALG